MFIPDIRYAKEVTPANRWGKLVVFPAYDIKFCDPGDPYRPVLEELDRVGMQRNLFLVSETDVPIWRVGDYEQTLPDAIVGIRNVEKEVAIADTFHGSILEVCLANGLSKRIDWQKS